MHTQIRSAQTDTQITFVLYLSPIHWRMLLAIDTG